MNIVLNILLVLVGFVSFIPVIQLYGSPKKSRYRCLKFLINTTFVWTLIVFVERFVSNLNVVYYAHLLSFPIKFLLAAFMLCTIYNYVEKNIPKWQVITLGVLFVAEYFVAMTNQFTQFIIDVVPGDLVSFETLYTADRGPIFIYHLLLTYLVLIIAIIYLYAFLRKQRGIRHYKAISRTMTTSIIVVLTFNILQLLVFKSSVDLTYVSLVIVVYTLYQVIYRKDMVFNLRTSGRGEILSNMREMYILTDSEKRVIEISNLLLSKYNLETVDYIGKPLSTLIDNLEEKVVFNTEYEVKNDHISNKDQLHIREKKFTLKGINDFGYIILIYDETQVFTLLRELNRLSNVDTMTNLNNRNYIEQRLETYKPSKTIGVVSLDLNGLKVNNDYLGHERGDYLLKSLAMKMKKVYGQLKSVEMARIGGDEFLIVVENTNLESLNTYKKNLLKECTADDLLENISVSVGVAIDEDGSTEIYELIKQADDNMYEMKRKESKKYADSIIEYTKKINKFIR